MMKEWKFRSKVLATAFLLNASMIAPGVGAYAASGDAAKTFGDVKQGAWYYDAVFYAKENAFMNGTSDTTFEPDKTLTRAEFVTVLHNVEGGEAVPVTEYNDIFTDVPQGKWYTEPVMWAWNNKITSGVSKESFGTDTKITREQLVTLLYKYASQKGEYELTKNADALKEYPDQSKINEWAGEAMQWAVTNGVVKGKAGKDGKDFLDPQGNASRAECAQMIKNFVENTQKSSQKDLPKKITLSGKREDHIITDELCYVEGDKFFLILDKDLDIPGDLAVNVELIMDQLEKETGLRFVTDRPIMASDNYTLKYGYNPWKNLEHGNKVPINIFVDREDAGYIPCAGAEFTNIYDYAMFSDEVWNSVPSYKENGWRRGDYVNYEVFAHELTHTLTLRYATLPKIMTEGGADYYAEKVIKALASKAEDINKSYDNLILDEKVKDVISPETAESVFRNDYSDLGQADRGDEYTLGRLISIFLSETYGDSFMKDYLAASEKMGYGYTVFFGNLQDADREKLTDEFKKLFGNDVFKKFGKWYQER